MNLHLIFPYLLTALLSNISIETHADTKLTFDDTGFDIVYKGSKGALLNLSSRQITLQVKGEKVLVKGDEVRSEGGKARIRGDKEYLLYDGEKKTLYVIDVSNRRFVEINSDKILGRKTKMVAMAKQRSEEPREKTFQLRGDQRRTVAELLEDVIQRKKASWEPSIKAAHLHEKAEKVERKEVIRGVECTNYIFKNDDGEPKADQCFASASSINAADHKTLVAMSEQIDSIAAASNVVGLPSLTAYNERIYPDGLLLRFRAFPKGRRVLTIAKEKLPDSDFRIPPNYMNFEPPVPDIYSEQ